MASNDYEFVTEWRVEAPRELIYDILVDGEDLPRWWPDVYLSAREERPPDGGEIGTRVHLHTRGWLPYTLRWTAETVRVDRPSGFEIRATGDFDGRGVWTLVQEGLMTYVRFDWRLKANKPILASLSFALKPIFSWNHRWAMARGYESLGREVARRRTAAPAASIA
jgi:uncharacterized protein YndB with AHSA1/START domain